MTTRMTRQKLEAACAAGALIRVFSSLDEGHTTGYVCAVSQELVLLNVVSHEIRFDGFQGLRLRDISRVLSPAPYKAFVERALVLRKLKRPRPPKLDLSDAHSLLVSASAAFPLVVVHREAAAPDVCHIGTVQSITTKWVTLREIGPNAKWDTKRRRYSLAEVTRVGVGGAYENALYLVASAR